MKAKRFGLNIDTLNKELGSDDSGRLADFKLSEWKN
jgi:hypothetical protein